VRQNDRYAGLSRRRDAAHPRDIDPSLLEALERYLTELIVANPGLEAYPAPERG